MNHHTGIHVHNDIKTNLLLHFYHLQKTATPPPKLQWLPTLSPKSRVPESVDSTWLQHQDPLESVQHGSRSTPACTHVPPLVLSSRPVECLLWRWPNLSHKIQPPRWRNDTLQQGHVNWNRSFEHQCLVQTKKNKRCLFRSHFLESRGISALGFLQTPCRVKGMLKTKPLPSRICSRIIFSRSSFCLKASIAPGPL